MAISWSCVLPPAAPKAFLEPAKVKAPTGSSTSEGEASGFEKPASGFAYFFPSFTLTCSWPAPFVLSPCVRACLLLPAWDLQALLQIYKWETIKRCQVSQDDSRARTYSCTSMHLSGSDLRQVEPSALSVIDTLARLHGSIRPEQWRMPGGK